MKTFTDTAGRTWAITLNIATIKRIRAVLDIDLLAKDLPDVVQRLICDPVTLCDTIYVAVKPAADQLGVSDEDFGRAMAGDPIDQATKALLEELVNFTPNPRDRARMARVIQTAWSMVDKAQDLLDEKTSEAAMQKEMASFLTILGGSSGKSPVSPESTPAP